MAPIPTDTDYYATLGITETADEAKIKSSYKRLAKLRHPDKNLNNPTATTEFQLLQTAYSTLIDPALRRIYDIQYPSIRLRAQATRPPPHATTNPGQTQPEPGPSSKSKPESDESQRYKQKLRDLEKELEGLYQKKARLDSHVIEAMRTVDKVQTALSKIQQEADREAQEDAARSSWRGHAFLRKPKPKDVKARERRTTERMTGRIVREAELERCMARLRQSQTQVDNIDAALAELEEKKSRVQQEEWVYQEAAMSTEEKRRRAQEHERVRQEEEKARKEQEARKEQKARRKQEERKEQEKREWLYQVLEKRRKEEEARRVREEMSRKAEAEQKSAANWSEFRRKEKEREAKEPWKPMHERVRRNTKEGVRMQNGKEGYKKASTRPGTTADTTGTFCRHQGWWNKESGSHVCGRCQSTTHRFAFRCSGCQTVACAECRRILKGGA